MIVNSGLLQRRDHGRRPLRFLFAQGFAHGVHAVLKQLFCVERRAPGQQFVKQHAQAVNVAARVNVQAAQFRLLRAHVGGRADDLFVSGKKRFVRQRHCLRRLGDAEINDLRHRHAIVERDEDVGRLDVAMDDAFLMRMLDGMANLR